MYFRHLSEDAPKEIHYAGEAGELTGLIVTLDICEDENDININTLLGFEVFLHHGQDYPDLSLYPNGLSPNAVQVMSITPSVIDSFYSVRNINHRVRGCRFEDEVIN